MGRLFSEIRQFKENAVMFGHTECVYLVNFLSLLPDFEMVVTRDLIYYIYALNTDFV